MKPKISEKVRMRKDLDGYLIYYPRGHIYLVNEIGYEILSLCNGENTIDDISTFLSNKYKIDKSKAYNDVKKFLKKFEFLLEYEQ